MSVNPVVRISKVLSLLTVTLLVLAGVSACGTSSDSTQDTITIGASLSLKGDFSDSGLGLKKGYELWADNINKSGGLLGKQIKIDILDDGGTPAQVTTNINTLIHNHKDSLVLGEVITGLAIPGFETADRYGYAYISPGGLTGKITAAEKDDNKHNVFGISLPIKSYLSSFDQYVLSLPADQKPQTVAFMGSQSPFATQQLAFSKAEIGDKLKVVLDAGGSYPEETTDYTPMAQQVVNSKADIVVLGSGSSAEAGAFIKAFKQQHYNPKALIATGGPDEGKAFLDAVGGADTAEGVFVPNSGWYPQIKNYQNDVFTKSYVAKYGGTADEIASDTVQGYAAGQVLEQAVKKANSFDNAKLQDVLKSASFDTVQGPVQFDETDHTNKVAIPFLFQWLSGHLQAVYPANEAQANPEYPKKTW
ncbi:amino acid ABC transporter substrate-binding protein [Tengunoibacter tsumagoiensis]|uniref:Branched-chain amino acid ABC transporter substrate-binding protein n=1 Tax=Tengunoibacter tsumagoiensis TaxID=2014871 RepID=A0A402A409_9CHLR|nr:amino acid ABC transporter substrate-binding protein [Tengunoibacter tsumagoiensis]GCE13799.1 branched-chain amino acid ABC transporter substrate-binding protein [Tengunoibacter tsumagoiensis]